MRFQPLVPEARMIGFSLSFNKAILQNLTTLVSHYLLFIIIIYKQIRGRHPNNTPPPCLRLGGKIHLFLLLFIHSFMYGNFLAFLYLVPRPKSSDMFSGCLCFVKL